MQRAANELSQVVRQHFLMHPARIACFLAMIWGIMGAKKVQLWAIAQQFGGNAQQESRIKRISRFLWDQALTWDCTAQCIIAFLDISGPVTLVIDRTNWSFGKTERNFLTLAIVHHGNAIPIFIKDLSRPGNSDTEDRKALLRRFITLFGADRIGCLLADREFVGQEWFVWLQENQVRSCIRVRNNTLMRHKNGGKVPAKHLLRDMKIGDYRTWKERLYGHDWRAVGLKLPDGDVLVLMADPDLPENLLPLYKIRWTIECLFKNQKTSGFSWETSHLLHPERGEKLAIVMALASAFAIKEGLIQHAIKPIPFRKTVDTLLFSFFTYGLRTLADAFKNTPHAINNPLILNGVYESVR